MNTINRKDGRAHHELRAMTITPHFISHHVGSCLITCGNTKVICSAIADDKVPGFLNGKGQGWITSEYSMIPASSGTRITRESTKGKVSGRTHEIQRLIGRSLRGVVDLKKLGERTIWIDCDVIQADGGTRTASITGSLVAMGLLIKDLRKRGAIQYNPLSMCVAAISAGVKDNTILLDLNYDEDSSCDVDMNIVMTEDGRFIEIQGTAEGEPFHKDQFDQILDVTTKGISQLIMIQKEYIGDLWTK